MAYEFLTRLVYVTILYKLMHTFSEIPLPNEQARLDILKIHAAPITKHGEIDYEGVVKLAEDFNGADLRNVCTEAGMTIKFFIIGFSPGVMYMYGIVGGHSLGGVCDRIMVSPLLPLSFSPFSPPSLSGMFAIRAEREYVESEDFMKAVRKVSDSKKLETKLDYKQI